MLVIPFPAIDPALLSVEVGGFTFSLRWYALAYVAGLLFGWLMVARLVKRPELWPGERAPLAAKQAEDLLTWMTVGVILGGRLGFVFFYNLDHYVSNPLDALKIWEGGMSFHGGLAGVALAVLGWSARNRADPFSVGDAVSMAAPPGLFLGRVANFINGELWGRESDAPWAMIFPNPHAGGVPRHPSQLYEAALEGLLLWALLWHLGVRRGWLRRRGAIFGALLVGYGLARVFVENFRNADAQFIAPDNPSGHVVRLTAELGLTMGQTLSLSMVAIGIGFLVLAFRRRPA